MEPYVNNYVRFLEGDVICFNDNSSLEWLQCSVNNDGVIVKTDTFGKYLCTLRPAVFKPCALKNVNIIGETFDKEQVQ